MARVVKNTEAQIITAKVITTFTDGNTSEKELKVGDMVEGLRYIENETLKSVTGKITKISTNTTKVTTVNLKAPEDYFAQDVQIKSITVDASEQYASNLVTVNAREIVEDEGITDVARVDVVSKATVTMDIEYTDGTVANQELNIDDVLADAVIMNGPGKPDITGDFKLKAFAYSIESGICKIYGAYLVSTAGGAAFVAPFKNFIRFDEKEHANVTNPSSLSSIADALNAAEDGVVFAELDVDVTIPKRDDGRITSLFVNQGQTLNIDLNGHSLDTQAYAFYVNGGVLNISDTSGTGAIKTHIANKAYPAVMVASGGVCNMDSGKIDTTQLDPEYEGMDGVVNWMYGVVCSGDGVFNMTGGEMVLDAASGISITNGTASGEGAQFIIGGNSKITSLNCAAVYLADNKKVVIKDNAVINGGIVVRLGDIIVEGNAVVNAPTIDPAPLGEFVMVSGVDTPSAAILAMTGVYNSELGNDLNISVAKTAKLNAFHDNGIDVATINTKYDQTVKVDIESSASVKAPSAIWNVYTHDQLAEMAAECGKNLPAETNTTYLTIKQDGNIVYPVLTEESAATEETA